MARSREIAHRGLTSPSTSSRAERRSRGVEGSPAAPALRACAWDEAERLPCQRWMNIERTRYGRV